MWPRRSSAEAQYSINQEIELHSQEKVIPQQLAQLGQHHTTIPPSRACLICSSKTSNTRSSDGLQPVLSPNTQTKQWKPSMITRPCRISLETAKNPSRSLPNTSLGSGLSLRRGNFWFPYSIEEPHLTLQRVHNHAWPRPTSKVNQRLSPAKESLTSADRQAFTHRQPPDINSTTRQHSSWLKLITTFLSETLPPSASKSRLCNPSVVLISFQITPQKSIVFIQRRFGWLESRGGAAAQTPIMNIGITAMHICYSPHSCRNHQSRSLYLAADLGLMIFFLFPYQSEKSLIVVANHTKKCAVHM